MKKGKLTVRDLCTIGLFAAIISILSQFSIPMPYGVPMTLQTFAVPLAGVILGPRKGMLSAILYLLIGAVGLPVFAGFASGVGVIFGLTGGFVFGFPFMALLAGWGARKGGVLWLAFGLVLAIAVDYTAGMLQFMLVSGSNLSTAFTACVLPFLPTEAIKALLVGTVGMKCRNALIKGGLVAA